MHGLISASSRRRQRRSARRHIRHGQRAAALRAFTAARLYLDKAARTVAVAAECTGSNPRYVLAALTLLRNEDAGLVKDVLRDRIPLLKAAAQVQRVVELVTAYRSASVPQRATAAKRVGIDTVWDEMIVPTIAVERTEATSN
jgi:hypothetical protein